jgi:hypothetical protein
VRGQDKLEEMMESFGLKDLSKEQLLTITKSFNTKLRQTGLDKNEEEETVKQLSYFGWLPELISISSTEVRKCCGLEAYLYLMFVRGSAQFFALVSVISLGTLIPTYTLGESNHVEYDNYMDRFTLLSALGKPYKMWIVFTVTVVIGISGHLFVYFFQT